jgi:hypothetical protein
MLREGATMTITEATLLRLRSAEHNVRSIAEHVADSPDPTVRVIARHVLRDLGEVEREIDAGLNAAARAALGMAEDRFALTVTGLLALRAAEG